MLLTVVCGPRDFNDVQASAAHSVGQKEDAFVEYLRVSDIVLKIIPKLKDFKEDGTYKALKARVMDDVLGRLEALQLELKANRRSYEQARRNSESSSSSSIPSSNGALVVPAASAVSAKDHAPARLSRPGTLSGEELDFLSQPSAMKGLINPTLVPPKPVAATGPSTPAEISPEKVYNYILDERVSILFLDLRGMAPYAQGHIAWKRPKWTQDARSGKTAKEAWEMGTVCCMEPEWFRRPKYVRSGFSSMAF